MKSLLLSGLLLLGAIGAEATTFRFSLFTEPPDLDPTHFSGNDTSYFIANLFRGLYRFDDQKGLVPVGAKSCTFHSPLKIVCKLNLKMKWSNGEAVVAYDYVRSFQHFLDPNSKAKDAGLLLDLKNAKDILAGKVPPAKLGVTATNINTLQFDFEKHDQEFLFKLSSPLFVPIKVIPQKNNPATHIFNGPYTLKEWKTGKHVLLEPNRHYPFGHKARPSIELLFIEEGTTAIDLYKLKKLDFVPEVAFMDANQFKEKPDFIKAVLARFDYIGFGEDLIPDKNLRMALSLSVDYEESKLVLNQDTRLGCTGLPDTFMDKIPCYNFDLKKAKEAFAKVDLTRLKGPLKLYFTKISSGNLKTIAEWYQAQWKKNLGIDVELQAMEFAMYRQQLRTLPPSLFRVGVSLDRPTCLAALETFQSQNKDNFLHLKNPAYDKLITDLAVVSNDTKRKTLCRKAVELLLNEYVLIPQGKVQYSRLLNPAFIGLSINSMGQIDFANLHLKP